MHRLPRATRAAPAVQAQSGPWSGTQGGPSRPTTEVLRVTRAAPAVQAQSGPWSGTPGTSRSDCQGATGYPSSAGGPGAVGILVGFPGGPPLPITQVPRGYPCSAGGPKAVGTLVRVHRGDLPFRLHRCHGLPEQPPAFLGSRDPGRVPRGTSPSDCHRCHGLPEQRRRSRGSRDPGRVPRGPPVPIAKVPRATRAAQAVPGQSGSWSGTPGDLPFRLPSCHGLPEQRRQKTTGSRDPGRVPRGPSCPTAEVPRATRAAPAVQAQSGPWSGTQGGPSRPTTEVLRVTRAAPAV